MKNYKPEILYGKDISELDREKLKNFESIVKVYKWVRVRTRIAFFKTSMA